MFTKFVLVIASLNSKSDALDALSIDSSRTRNNLLTLILSNADGTASPVSYADNSSIEEFTVDLQVQYWEAYNGNKGIEVQ